MNLSGVPLGRLKRASLRAMIGFLAAAALFSILVVLFGEFDDFEVHVLLSAVVVAATSLSALCCSAYGERRGNPGIAWFGNGLAAAAAVMGLAGIWGEIDSDGFWKTMFILSLQAGALAHSLALMIVELPAGRRWLPVASAINTFALAILFSGMALGEAFEEEELLKVAAAQIILLVLATITVPIVGRLSRGAAGDDAQAARPDELNLRRQPDGTWSDAGGNAYRVERVVRDPDRQ